MSMLGGVPPTMDGIVNNPLQGVQTAPPQSTEEVTQRRGEWSKLLDDPNAKAALFRMGLSMMQGTRRGESALAATGRKAIDAMDYYGAVTELDRKRNIDAQKLALDTKNVNSQIEGREAQTVATKQQTQQESAKFTEWQSESESRKAKNKLDIETLISQNKLREAQSLKASFEADEAKRKADFIKANPELAATAMKAELLKPEAELNQTYAQTGNAEANMRRTDALMGIDAEQLQLDKDELQAKIDGKLPTGGDTPADYEGLASSILSQYDKADKKRYPDIDKFITENFNVTLGKSASGVMTEIKRQQALRTPPGAPPSGAKTLTEADITETMAASGKSRAQVVAAAKQKGYIIQGK